MAAGLGFKTFTTGEVLTAADTNGYLMQGVLVFADAAARTAAITSPQEGQTSYLKDTDEIQVYSGSAWVTKSGSLPSQTGNSGKYLTTDGTTASWGTVSAGGMTSIASGSLSGSSVTITSIAGTYKNLILSIDNPYHSNQPALLLRFNGDSGASNYRWVSINTGNTSVNTSSAGSSISLLPNNIGGNSTSYASAYVEIPNYALTNVRKAITTIGNYGDGSVPLSSFATGGWVSASAITSITILVSSDSFTGGTYTLYGVN